MRVWHLFTHMSGLTYGFLNAHPVDALYRAGGFEWGTPPDLDLAGVCDRLATFPLLFQPGTEWNYGYSNDVLGRVVEVATGRPFADVVQDTVLDPLGMTETTWFVPETEPRPTRGAVRADARVGPRRRHGDPLRRPGCRRDRHRRQATMGGQGLCGTTADYLRFMAMLAGRGELDGVRIVAPHSVDYMASNHLPGGQDLAQFGRPLFAETTFDGVGFGLGVSVVTDPVKSKVPYSRGEFGWGGAASTTFWIDPVYDITAVFMTQLMPSDTLPIRPQLRQLVKAALVAPDADADSGWPGHRRQAPSAGHQVDREPVEERRRHDDRVPHLVIAERRRPRVGLLRREHDRAERVEQAAGGEERELDVAHRPDERQRVHHQHPARSEVHGGEHDVGRVEPQHPDRDPDRGDRPRQHEQPHARRSGADRSR